MIEHPSDAQLVMHLAGELHQPERQEVAHHLLTCAECVQQLDQFRQLETVLTGRPRMAIPESFAARVRARATLVRSRRLRPFAAAACALLLLGAVGGWTAQSLMRTPPRAMVRTGPGNRFMILFVENMYSRLAGTDEERRRAALDFGAWFGQFPGDVMLGGAQLVANDTHAYGAATGSRLPAAGDSLQLTGFIVVRAASHAEVARYAERCPIIGRGGHVIVRQIY